MAPRHRCWQLRKALEKDLQTYAHAVCMHSISKHKTKNLLKKKKTLVLVSQTCFIFFQIVFYSRNHSFKQGAGSSAFFSHYRSACIRSAGFSLVRCFYLFK
jgi:hypothetical protein